MKLLLMVCIKGRYISVVESKKLRYWAISCVYGKGWNTYNEARDYAKTCVNYT